MNPDMGAIEAYRKKEADYATRMQELEAATAERDEVIATYLQGVNTLAQANPPVKTTSSAQRLEMGILGGGPLRNGGSDAGGGTRASPRSVSMNI